MALDAAAQSLEVEQEKIDMLLHELLPRKVADQLKKGEKVEAGQYSVRLNSLDLQCFQLAF